MKKTLLNSLLLVSAFAMGIAQAAPISELNWTGRLTITGFGATGPNNLDGNPTTMTLRYDIADGSSHTIGATTGNEIVTGSIIIKDLLGPGNDFSLNPGLVSHIAEHATLILPLGTTTFPTGVSPAINLTGTPVFSTNVQNLGTGINSNLDITRDFFDGNVFEEDIIETASLGPNSLWASFNGFDTLLGNSDGLISRDFELNIQISPIPVPAAVWLFMSGMLGLFSMSKRKQNA